MNRTPIVVTGIGLVTPLGAGRETVWRRLLAGESGIRPVASFDTSAYPVHLGAEVPDDDARVTFDRIDPTTVPRASRLAMIAAREALADAGLDADDVPAARAGVAMGTTSGEPVEIERHTDRAIADTLDRADDALVRRYPCHVIAGTIAAELGFGGPTIMIPAACAAGSYAIAHGVDQLRAGRVDVVLAGGADAFSRITYTGFARLGAIAPEVCQPFDRQRKGMVPGEGAGVLVLERARDARARGARVYAEVAGYGLSCDAHHMTAAHPEGAGAARAMSQALAEADLPPSAVSYVSAHGTGTPTNDKLETKAVQRVFGARARHVPTSSIKSMIGHTMGAASAIESGVCALAVAEDRVPPTMNFATPDPECDLDCIPNEARSLPVEVAMNNAYAFGGNNASVLFTKPSA